MEVKRDFKIVVSDIGDDEPVALLRCPECGSKNCKMINAALFHNGIMAAPQDRGINTSEITADTPKTNGVNMTMVCDEAHIFWYWFHSGGGFTAITHGVFEESLNQIGGA